MGASGFPQGFGCKGVCCRRHCDGETVVCEEVGVKGLAGSVAEQGRPPGDDGGFDF